MEKDPLVGPADGAILGFHAAGDIAAGVGEILLGTDGIRAVENIVASATRSAMSRRLPRPHRPA